MVLCLLAGRFFGDTVYHPGDVVRLTSGNHGIIVHIMKRESGVKSLALVFAGRCDRPKSRVIRFEDMELIKFPEGRLGPVQRSKIPADKTLWDVLVDAAETLEGAGRKELIKDLSELSGLSGEQIRRMRLPALRFSVVQSWLGPFRLTKEQMLFFVPAGVECIVVPFNGY